MRNLNIFEAYNKKKICQRKLYKVFCIKTRSSINLEIKERNQNYKTKSNDRLLIQEELFNESIKSTPLNEMINITDNTELSRIKIKHFIHL